MIRRSSGQCPRSGPAAARREAGSAKPRWRLLACVAGLGLGACEDAGRVIELRENFPARDAVPFAVPEPRTRVRALDPETYRFVAAIGGLESQIAELKTNLASVQELHETFDFDTFLQLDPWTVDKESLFYLSHFCDAGYFSVQRKILLSLLERKIARAGSGTPAAPGRAISGDLQQRLAEAMILREERIMDLEHVLHLYATRQGAGEFLIPDHVDPQELEGMRADVAARLGRQRALVAELDSEIQMMKLRLGAL